MMDYKDYYQILGVDRNAGEREIKQAYRKMAMKYHPDRNPNDRLAEERFKDINEAYQVLGDSGHRQRYDEVADSYTHWNRNKGSSSGYNWEEWVSTPSSQSHAYVYRTPQDGFVSGFSLNDFSEFFQRIFAGIASHQKEPSRKADAGSSRANPFEYHVSISFAEAYSGTVRKLDVDGKRLEVKIPAGARTGTKVRVANAISPPGKEKRDLFLLIMIADDPYYQRKGNDLHVNLKLDLNTAILGGEVTVRTPGGNVLLTIPPGTQPGKVFRLAAKGMPQLKNPSVRGSQYVHVTVQIPEELSAEQRELFQKLASLNSRRN